MEAVAEPISFGAIAAPDVEEFQKQKEKILSAVIDRLECNEAFRDLIADPERARLARECAKIFVENLQATMKYQLPTALIEYLDWLRSFLTHRHFPASFIPNLLAATRTATHAFMEQYNSDAIAEALRQLQQREHSLSMEAEA